MASSKEMGSARPLAHRPSMSTSSSNGQSGRSSHARNNSHSSHSLLTSSLNPNHRVTRRKSVTGPNANLAAVTAALHGQQHGDKTITPLPITGRRNTVSSKASSGGRFGLVGSLPSPPPSLPGKSLASEITSAIDDANELSADDGASTKDDKARVRRASDGQPLTKEGKKGGRVELQCQHCGKGYKHSSCLTKHLWEHTPEWSLTSKLLISKHQQVQLLEAATVLVKMNNKPDKKDDVATPPESTKDFPSDQESAPSPPASTYSDQGERLSSADTTPPPMAEGLGFRSKRLSSSGYYSRSYQSVPSLHPGSLPGGHGHARRPSDNRPMSSGTSNTGQEDRDLAAAVELLSCSFNSNQGSNGTVMLSDAPPVPPVPAQYRDQATSFGNPVFFNSFPSRQPESFTRGAPRGGSEDVKMSDSADSGLDDNDFDTHARRGSHSDEDDDGVFGSMEE